MILVLTHLPHHLYLSLCVLRLHPDHLIVEYDLVMPDGAVLKGEGRKDIEDCLFRDNLVEQEVEKELDVQMAHQKLEVLRVVEDPLNIRELETGDLLGEDVVLVHFNLGSLDSIFLEFLEEGVISGDVRDQSVGHEVGVLLAFPILDFFLDGVRQFGVIVVF